MLKEFRFVFTGGTYNRLFEGELVTGTKQKDAHTYKLPDQVKKFLYKECGVVRLPPNKEGGVTILANLVTRRLVSLLWLFFSPLTAHLLFPENLALLRLADLYRVKKLMNTGSVNEWLEGEAERDTYLNRRELNSLDFEFPGTTIKAVAVPDPKVRRGLHIFGPPKEEEKGIDVIRAKENGTLDEDLKSAVLALISHDAMKDRMLDFAMDHEQELKKFGQIITTGTTGSLIREALPDLEGIIHRYHSGPKGGDVEIATQVLFKACDVVIFFVDPLHPHPHTEDIRVIFGACMVHNQVRMLSNEVQARDWMDRLIRGA
jgi:methylglyoxal synthase